MPVRYLRLSFQIEGDPADSASAELLTAALWERGTLGVELCDATRSLVAYFPFETSLEGVSWELHGGRLIASEPFAEEDWLAGYRLAARPLRIGRRLLVDPGEPDRTTEPEPAAGDRRLLRLPARTAFGTGSHASTRLAVELMEELDLEGLDVLDVGFGSGILSFAAQLGGASRVVGVEIDAQAALVAAQNRSLNRLYPAFVAGGVEVLRRARRFDLALVNVLPERVEDDLEAIAALLRPGAHAVFSGILSGAAAAVLRRLRAVGFVPRERRTSEEWSAFLMGSTQPGAAS